MDEGAMEMWSRKGACGVVGLVGVVGGVVGVGGVVVPVGEVETVWVLVPHPANNPASKSELIVNRT